DLLHIDAFPSRPTLGRRILRLYVNLHVSAPRVWVTSERFGPLFERYGREAGLPEAGGGGWARRLRDGFLSLFDPSRRWRTAYDFFMLRFHDFLKKCERVQEESPKRFWVFPPGSAWLLFSDGLAHADLRGRFALDHSYFIAPETLVLPAESPACLLERACGMPVNRAA